MGVRNYLAYRRHGFSVGRSFDLAFGRKLSDFALSIAFYLASLAVVTWLFTAAANALVVEYDARQAVSAQYTTNLERTLATCLTRGDNPITIGDELWFCGATPAGVHPTRR